MDGVRIFLESLCEFFYYIFSSVTYLLLFRSGNWIVELYVLPLMFLIFFHTSSVRVSLVMVEVYVFHDSLLLCLISFRNLARSVLNLVKFSVVFFGFVKSLVAFFKSSLTFFYQGVECFFFVAVVVFWFPWRGCFLRCYIDA